MCNAVGACPKEATRKKRGRPRGSKIVAENVSKKSKAIAPRKPCGSKKSSVNDDGTLGWFQQIGRCSFGEVEAMKFLKEAHREKVSEAGFGCVFGWVLEGNVTRVLMCFLLKKINLKTMKIDCGSG